MLQHSNNVDRPNQCAKEFEWRTCIKLLEFSHDSIKEDPRLHFNVIVGAVIVCKGKEVPYFFGLVKVVGFDNDFDVECMEPNVCHSLVLFLFNFFN